MIEGFLIYFLIVLIGVMISALAFNLIAGYTGQLNLGFAAVGAAGAYVTAILTLKFGFPIVFGIIIASLFSALLSVVIGLPTNKVKESYFHLASLGFVFILGGIARNWIGLTNGALGIKGIPRLFSSNLTYLVFMVIILVLVCLIFLAITKSHLGRIFKGIRDDELALKSLGYNTYNYKLLAFAISGFFGGLGWSIWAHFVTFIDPTLFNLSEVVLLLAIVVLGGLASIRGSIIGALIVFTLPQLLRFVGLPSASVGYLREILYALILILVLVYKPRGLFGKADIK